jgi:hypothetical protein
MLGEFFGWLVVLSETLALDGMIFRPSHYHLAAVARSYVRFVDPAAAGLLRALEELLSGVPLEDASRAVEEGRVVDRTTGQAVRWEAWPMVLAASQRLKERTEGEAYEAAAAEAFRRLHLRLTTKSTVNS